MIHKIAIVGSGNVAQHLIAALSRNGLNITCIASRNRKHALELASEISCSVCKIESIPKSADLVIIAVSDDAISEVIQKIPVGDYIVVHTSGSISMDVFKNRFDNYGVLYPLQSFLKSRKINFRESPILIEGNTEATTIKLISLANQISNRIEVMNSEKREILHLSAVIVNNFVNFLAAKSFEFLDNNNIEGDLLQPLLKETLARLQTNHPSEMQTGPAKRNDKKVIEKHLKQLDSNPKLQSLYRLISQQITEEYYGSKL